LYAPTRSPVSRYRASAAANIASLIEACAAHPGRRVLNSADPDAPNGLEIARVVAAHLGHEWDAVLLDDEAPPQLGRHPWDRRPPFVLDTSAALALGWQPAGTYAATVSAELDWLVSGRAEIDDGDFAGDFDYASEDAWLATGAARHAKVGSPARADQDSAK